MRCNSLAACPAVCSPPSTNDCAGEFTLDTTQTRPSTVFGLHHERTTTALPDARPSPT